MRLVRTVECRIYAISRCRPGGWAIDVRDMRAHRLLDYSYLALCHTLELVVAIHEAKLTVVILKSAAYLCRRVDIACGVDRAAVEYTNLVSLVRLVEMEDSKVQYALASVGQLPLP